METTLRRSLNVQSVAVLLSTALILGLTLFPMPLRGTNPCAWFVIACGGAYAVDFVLNLLLFVPLGASLFRLGLAALWCGAVGAGLSAAVEALQFFVVPGRDPSLRDFLANSLGSLLGAALAMAWPALARPSASQAQRVLTRASGAVTALLLLGGLALRPSAPSTAWYGQWAPDLGDFDRFQGQVSSASLGGDPLPSGKFPNTEPYRQRVRDAGVVLEATIALPSNRTPRMAPIVSVFDNWQRRVTLLGQLGDDLVFEPRTAGEDWGLQGLGIRGDEALAGSEAATRLVRGSYQGGRLEVVVRDPGGSPTRASAQRVIPVDAWRTLLLDSLPISGATALALDALWLLLIFLLLGRWGRAGSPWEGRSRLGLGLACLIPAATALAPIAVGLPLAPWPCWVAVALGWGAGWRWGGRPHAAAR